MKKLSITLAFFVALVFIAPSVSHAQKFDFERLRKATSEHTVILQFTLEVTFGMNSSTDEHRALGTICSADGLVLFDGTFLDTDGNFGSNPGFNVRITPLSIKAIYPDGTETSAEYLGLDRATKFGVARMAAAKGKSILPAKFSQARMLGVGTWVATNTLLPELVNPPLGGNVGLISAMIESPQQFPVTVGLGPNELGSVVYDDRLNPIGILGFFQDGGDGGPFATAQEGDFPMLGVITSDRIARVVANPPGTSGVAERSWLGITLQALTPDIGEALGVSARAGIIVTEVIAASPAEKAGMKVGDIITRFNSEAVAVDKEERISLFQRKVSESKPGTTIRLGTLREKETGYLDTTLAVLLEKAPISARDAEEFKDERLEMTVRDLVFSDFVIRNLESGSVEGVVVSSLESGGLAVVGGLEMGDIIQRIGSSSVASVSAFQQVVTESLASGSKELIFFVWRDGRTQFVNVRLN